MGANGVGNNKNKFCCIFWGTLWWIVRGLVSTVITISFENNFYLRVYCNSFQSCGESGETVGIH